MANQILFLCTGNYYRSRFAEALFNHLAAPQNLPWRASSAGLRVQADGIRNVGPLSPFTRTALETRRIPLPVPDRFPRQVTPDELASARLIIALKELEHRPLLESLHPEHAPRVTYWHVHDLDMATPDQAMAEIEGLVCQLLEALPR